MKLPRNVDGDELARLLSAGMGIVSTTRRAVTSVCQQSFTGRPRSYHSPSQTSSRGYLARDP